VLDTLIGPVPASDEVILQSDQVYDQGQLWAAARTSTGDPPHTDREPWPEGNLTGGGFLTGSLMPKRLELLVELVHGAAIAVLANPAYFENESQRKHNAAPRAAPSSQNASLPFARKLCAAARVNSMLALGADLFRQCLLPGVGRRQ
jgi:hypothetical protein